MAESKHTTSHNTIKKWAEARKGKPTAVKETHSKKETGIVRLSFPGRKTNHDNLTEISWDEFFKEFEKSKLAMVYQEKTKTGKQSRFNKLVNRNSLKKSTKTSNKSHSKPESKHTTSHNTIKKWAEARKGKPTAVKATQGKNETGIVRLSFPGRKTNHDNLTEISWDKFFEKFEESKLAMVYQEETKTGRPSRFNKLVSRDSFKKSAKTSGTRKSKPKSKKSGTITANNSKAKAASNRKPVKNQTKSASKKSTSKVSAGSKKATATKTKTYSSPDTSPGKIRTADDPRGGEFSGIPGTTSKGDIGK
ncbi:MAG: hypothetical protein ACK4ND_01310 [Cytophagaceae bacterium]